jgi:protein TonB
MFQQLIASAPAKASRKSLTLVFSATLHGLLILLLIVVPLAHPETLATLLAPPPPLLAPRRTLVKLMSSAGQPRATAARPNILITPDFIPATIDLTSMKDSGPTSDNTGGISQLGFPMGGDSGSDRFLEGFSSGPARAVLPPEPPAPTEKREKPTTRVRRGGEVQDANLLHQVTPAYPQLAKIARVQGTVILEALIDREGRVKNLRVVSGHPLLVLAACGAVQQWRYRPTLLNGEPVEVLTQITVNFNLGAS